MTAELDTMTSKESASHSGPRDCSGEGGISLLTDEERIQITKALQQWAKQAPNDELTIEFVGRDRCLTRFEVYIEVERDTADGQSILRILEHGVREEGLEQIISRLTDEGT
jgi:hypothetical protein